MKPELAGFDRLNIYELEFMVYGYIRRTKGIVGIICLTEISVVTGNIVH